MSNWFKRNGIHLAIIGVFIALGFFYCAPVFQGKALFQSDVMQAQGMQREIMSVKEKTGKAPLWTNSMFGGMPAYQIWVPYPTNVTTYVISTLKAVFPNPVDTILLYLVGAYFLLCVLRLNPWLAAAGAIAYAFSSYNFIIIDAGHANQAYAIAFFAPIIASILLAFRGRPLLGATLTAFFLAMEIRTNHIQMTYYLMLAILIWVGIELYHAIKENQTKPFFKAIGYLAAATVLAVVVNAAMLWTTYEYGNESIRGKSNLTQHTTEPSNGLDKDYAYQYSQGIGECFTFLIPNAYGGTSSGPTNSDSNVLKVLTDKGIDPNQAQSLAQQFPLYWGDKPIIGGPWYFGAAVCFLFVLGLLIVKNRLKWWLLGATLLSLLLSFGQHLTFISDLFFNYFPLYNKFRTVESILVIAALCFPVLAFMAIQEVISSTDKSFIFKKVKLALYITGGLTLLMIVVPSVLLSFKSPEHQNFVAQLTQMAGGDSAFANNLANALVQDRISLERADAIRSLIFILIAFGLLWAFVKQKVNVTVLSIAFLLLTLVDMWTVDKRYLKDSNFVDKEDLQQSFQQREVDQFILRDTDPDYRVFDATLSPTPFSNATASYFHKTVGGYHAAKLKRFQELIESQFSKSVNQDVLDMLNTKYIITADPKTQAVGMQVNQTACGHAWFVKSVKYAKNADEEMQAISSFDPKNEAIVDERYHNLLNNKITSLDEAATIKLLSYNPDHLVYETGSTTNQVAVFSEIYYDKGWKMLIDGVEKPYFRADYVLRAAEIPVGNHKIEFVFHPTSYYTGEGISLAGSAALVLLLVGVGYAESKKKGPLLNKEA
ncbi:YfhO family protein [Mucilaginibacter robiniae]|uniref:YfhO family protein n=1 Tax=Mucilaginibacter robiniae TaxID=2728022 RepID=A0A7L5E2W5_9SPHI|nr:YfhO family protein [Mucilaginibacter robiniae]QJD95133.1 YfhO family protein [Mucilaginibacter robiniae]